IRPAAGKDGELLHFCAAPNCTRKSTQSDLAFFKFPRDPARCQKWVDNCRGADLEDKTPDQLNKHDQLCATHFETSMICRTILFSPYRTVLRDNAIPTIFDLTSHLNNTQSRHRKRIKELIDEISEQEQKRKETNNSNQNIPLDGYEADEIPEDLFTPDNFQALLECRKQFETTAVNTLFCSKTQQKQMLEICESLRDSHFFSIITDNVVDIAGEEHLPVLVRFVDESHNLREEFVGFLPYEADAEILAVKFHTMITEKWGLNTEYCRGQAYIASSGFSSKMKVVASRLLEKYPQAIYMLYSSCAINMWLAKSVPVMGVSVALGTIEEVCSFFYRSPQLLLELDNVISVLFQNSKERGKELKEICHSQHDAFEFQQALVLCLESINSDTNIRWNNCIAGRAFVLCTFGKNLLLQEVKPDVFFAAGSLTAVLHSLNEVIENIEVYHEFWFEEATNLATKLDLQMKLPGKFRSAHQGNLESQLTSESYYKETLNVPKVEHIIQELKDIFSEQHLKALKCLSLVPAEEHHADMLIKWKHRGKDTELPSTICEALHLPDIKFFLMCMHLLKVLCILPVMKHLKAYLKYTLTDQRSSNLALLNINFDIKHDLDLMVDKYIKLYTSKSPTFNSLLSRLTLTSQKIFYLTNQIF
uniref:THAP-type domain-containing protein n=1 Tax=Gorilla gorilla gorilla TaxID=9595 RepID=A0A2I2YND5_GORGO